MRIRNLPLDSILLRSINTLPLSTKLMAICEGEGIKTLADLLSYYITELLALPGMDFVLWNEYVAFLEENGLGHFLDRTEPDSEGAVF